MSWEFGFFYPSSSLGPLAGLLPRYCFTLAYRHVTLQTYMHVVTNRHNAVAIPLHEPHRVEVVGFHVCVHAGYVAPSQIGGDGYHVPVRLHVSLQRHMGAGSPLRR